MEVPGGRNNVICLQQPYTPTPENKGVGCAIQEGISAGLHFRRTHVVGAEAYCGFADLISGVLGYFKNGLGHAPLQFVTNFVRPLDSVLPRNDVLFVPVIRQQ